MKMQLQVIPTEVKDEFSEAYTVKGEQGTSTEPWKRRLVSISVIQGKTHAENLLENTGQMCLQVYTLIFRKCRLLLK